MQEDSNKKSLFSKIENLIEIVIFWLDDTTMTWFECTFRLTYKSRYLIERFMMILQFAIVIFLLLTSMMNSFHFKKSFSINKFALSSFTKCIFFVIQINTCLPSLMSEKYTKILTYLFVSCVVISISLIRNDVIRKWIWISKHLFLTNFLLFKVASQSVSMQTWVSESAAKNLSKILKSFQFLNSTSNLNRW